MIVFLCGLVGSGKTTLARATTVTRGLRMYDMDALKRDIYPKDPDFERNMRLGMPFGHATRMAMFTRAASELTALAQEHRHIVADEALHMGIYRTFLRTTLAAEGLQTFFVWIEPSPSIAEARLLSPREGHMLQGNAIPMLRAMRMESDNTASIDATLHNTSSIHDAVATLEKILDPLLA